MRVNYIGKKLHAQGPGIRYTLWTQGCSIHCPGCSNKDTWDFSAGSNYSVKELADDILSTEGINGLTITGGEPLDQFDEVYELCKLVFDKMSIFLTTGYQDINLEQMKIISVLDILCKGPFKIDKICKDGWRGSSNQEVCILTKRGKLEQEKYPPVYKEIIVSPKGNAIETGFHI